MRRFEALDGIRGVAAAMVLFYHIGLVSQCDWLAPYGYLAVDLFFMLSGFVIAAAYEQKLDRGMSFTKYMIGIRIPRLYPMILLGAALGLIATVIGAHNVPTPHILFIKQLMLIPTFLPMEIYPTNNVMWSLALELFINAAHAMAYPYLKSRNLTYVIVAAFFALIGAAWFYRGLNVGWNSATAPGGFVRVFFAFPLGLLLYRMHSAGKLPKFSFGFLGIAGIVIIAVALPMPTNAHHIRTLHDLAVVAVLFPLVLVAGANFTVGEKWRSSISALGDFSYPLYAIHLPVIFLYGFALDWLGMSSPLKLLAWIPFSFAVTGLAWFVDRTIEKPFQRWRHARGRRGSHASFNLTGALGASATSETGETLA